MQIDTKNVLFIYNPIAGSGTIAQYIDQIVNLYQQNGYSVTLLRICKERNYSSLPMYLEQSKPEHILVAGGDGTVNRLVNFMQHHSLTTPIAALPTGTANDFANLMGVPSNPLKAVQAVIDGKKSAIDLARVGDHYFVNVLSGGLMSDISHRTPLSLKNLFGKGAYFLSGVTVLPNFRRININVSSKELTYNGKCLLVMIFNGRTAGSFKVARRSSVTDGLLDVFIFKGTNIRHTMNMLSYFLLNRKGEYPSDVVYFQTDRLRIDLQKGDVSTDVDGEPGKGFPFEVECLPRQLNVIIPKV